MAEIYTAMPEYYAKLQNGSTGPDVALVQTWLNGLRTQWPALPRLTVDGKFGTATQKAVETFQIANGLAADGVVGKNTWNALYSRYADVQGAGHAYPGLALRKGARGATVKAVQQKLQTLIPELAADGRFGAKTEAAVLAWQAVNKLAADGVVGKNTWESLF